MPKRLFFWTCLTLVLVAYLINTGRRFTELTVYFDQDGFLPLLIGTCFLLWIYMGLVVFFASLFLRHKPTTRQRFYYYLTAITTVLALNTYLLSMLFAQHQGKPYLLNYLKTGFVFFLIPVLFYVLLVERLPHFSWPLHQLNRLRANRSLAADQPENSVGDVSTENTSSANSLNRGLRKIWIQDVVEIVFRRNGAIVYLVTGEGILFDRTSSAIEEWANKDWFVKIKKHQYVNMLHWSVGAKRKYELKLNDDVLDSYREVRRMTDKAWKEHCTVSERMRVNLTQYIEKRLSATSFLRDEYFSYLPV